MASSPLLIFLSLLSLLTTPSLSQTCTSQKFTNNKLYNRCNDLPQLGSSLHWSYNPSKSTVSIAFIAPPAKPDGWIAWAINPTGTGMVGAQTLVALKAANGSMVVKSYNISGYQAIVEGKLAFDVTETMAEYSGGLMKLFATVTLPEKLGTVVNQVWQVGPAVMNGFPVKHDFGPANLQAKGTVDFLSGQSSGGTGGGSGLKKRNIHGILNAVSWGILFPMGAIIARYLRTFKSADPAWFYLHAFCQFSGYVVGVAGWATGLKLGSESKGVQYTGHRNIGIALFTLATVQIFALFLRPNKEHKYRFYWNIYHHTLGYSILVLGVINVFKGLDILDPEKKWKSAYVIVIVALGVIALLLEAITWIVVLRRRSSSKSTKPYDGYTNGESRQQPLAP